MAGSPHGPLYGSTVGQHYATLPSSIQPGGFDAAVAPAPNPRESMNVSSTPPGPYNHPGTQTPLATAQSSQQSLAVKIQRARRYFAFLVEKHKDSGLTAVESQNAERIRAFLHQQEAHTNRSQSDGQNGRKKSVLPSSQNAPSPLVSSAHSTGPQASVTMTRPDIYGNGPPTSEENPITQMETLLNKAADTGLTDSEIAQGNRLDATYGQAGAKHKQAIAETTGTQPAMLPSQATSLPVVNNEGHAETEVPVSTVPPNINRNLISMGYEEAQSRLSSLHKGSETRLLTSDEYHESEELMAYTQWAIDYPQQAEHAKQAEQARQAGQARSANPTACPSPNGALPMMGSLHQAGAQQLRPTSHPVESPQTHSFGPREAEARLIHLRQKHRAEGLTPHEIQHFHALARYLQQVFPQRWGQSQQARGAESGGQSSRGASSASTQQPMMLQQATQSAVYGAPPSTVRNDGRYSELNCRANQAHTPQQGIHNGPHPQRHPTQGTEVPRNVANIQSQVQGDSQEPIDLLNLQKTTQRPQGQNFNACHSATSLGDPRQSAPNAAQRLRQAAPGESAHPQNPKRGTPAPRVEQPQQQVMGQQSLQQAGTNLKFLPPRTPAISEQLAHHSSNSQPYASSSVQGAMHPSTHAPQIQTTGLPSRQRAEQIPPTMNNPAGQKRRLDSTGPDHEDIQSGHPAKKARVNGTPNIMPQQSQERPAPPSQRESTLTLSIGDLDPALADKVLREAIETMQAGGKMMPVPEGMDGVTVAKHSYMACLAPGSSVVYGGFSNVPDMLKSWRPVPTRSFREGIIASSKHHQGIGAGIPPENLKIEVFDDRRMRMVPVSDEVKDSSKKDQSEARTDIAGNTSDQGQSSCRKVSQNKSFVTPANEPPAAGTAIKDAADRPVAGPGVSSSQEAPSESNGTCKAKIAEGPQSKAAPAAIDGTETESSVPWVPTHKESEEKRKADAEARFAEHVVRQVEAIKATDAPFLSDINDKKSSEQEELRDWCKRYDRHSDDDDADNPPASVSAS